MLMELQYKKALETIILVKHQAKPSRKLRLLELEALIKTGETEMALNESAKMNVEFHGDSYYFYLRGLALIYSGYT